MKVLRFIGTADGRGEWDVQMEVEEPVGAVGMMPLPLQLEIRNHSPTGFAWGYHGSGPSQLALAILMQIDPRRAVLLYQAYKRAVIARLPIDKGFVLPAADVRDWLNNYQETSP